MPAASLARYHKEGKPFAIKADEVYSTGEGTGEGAMCEGQGLGGDVILGNHVCHSSCGDLQADAQCWVPHSLAMLIAAYAHHTHITWHGMPRCHPGVTWQQGSFGFASSSSSVKVRGHLILRGLKIAMQACCCNTVCMSISL